MTSHAATAETIRPAPPAAARPRLALEAPRPRRTPLSRPGEAALGAVRWGILERVGRYGRLRIETIPATWPMTRHLVRRLTEQLVEEGLLELSDGAVVLTAAGATARETERRRRGA